MSSWKRTAYLLCLFGMVKKFHPSSPFLTPFLMSSSKNFTDVQIYSQIYPLWTYSYLTALIPIFFLTDILRYKPILIIEALSYCISTAIILWGKHIWHMQIMEIFYGLTTASEVAYFSYLYAIVDTKHFKRVTSYIRAATLTGKFLAYGFGQLLISFHFASYLQLVQVSFCSTCIALLISCILPPVSSKIAASGNNGAVDKNGFVETPKLRNHDSESVPSNAKQPTVNFGLTAYFRAILRQFNIFKNNVNVLKWSVWWALTSCGASQACNYVQNLWAVMQEDGKAYNGITECATTMIGALVTFLMQYMKVDWTKHDEIVLVINPIIGAALLIFMSQTTNVSWAYIFHIAFTTINQLLFTMASANIASQLNTASYGLVFGWTTFVALLLQTILTFIVTDQYGLALNIRAQFVVYGYYFGAIALIFMCLSIWKITRKFFASDIVPK